MRPARRVHLPAAVAVLVLSGCQAVTGAVDSASVRDHEDLRGDLVASGLGEDETDCIMAELDRQIADLGAAIEASGGDRDQFELENQTAFQAAIGQCVDLSSLDEQERTDFRRGFIEGAVADPSLGIDEEQAACIYDELLASGLAPEDLFEPGNAALPDASAKAFAACGVEQRGVEDIPEEDLRRAFVAGFAQASGATQQEAGCVFDTMVDRGIPPVDFAGPTLSPEADRALPAVLEECGVQG